MKADIVSRHEPIDLATIGETMVAFVSRNDPHHYLAVPAGAESNLAIGMARLGCRTQWVSRLGADPLGSFVEESVSATGVDVDVIRDDVRPTGVMTIQIDGPTTFSTYYRSESAARSLSPVDLGRLSPARWTHVTGITPALSESASDLIEAVVVDRAVATSRVSFDVNYRPGLWPDPQTAADLVARLARAADIVFIGEDESDALFATIDEAALAALVLQRDDQELVLKRGPGPASVVTVDGVVTEPACRVDVVEATGAGDAFAAGYLAATVFGWSAPARLRLGHLMASRVVGVLDHVSPDFTGSERADISPAGLAARWREIDV